MAKTAVLFQSSYGSTKLYAQHIASILDADLFDLGASKKISLDNYDTVIFGGGLYAGKINGIKSIGSNANALVGKNLVVFTVGIGDPSVAVNAQQILKGVNKALPKNLMKSTHIYSFRGALDSAKLKFIHKMMMKMLKGMLQKKKEEERTDDDRAILRSFEEKIDFTDMTSALPLIEYVSNLK